MPRASVGVGLVLLVAWIMGGCGGGSDVAPGPDNGGDGGGVVTTSEVSTASFIVDVETGDVTVTHSDGAQGTMGTAAAFTGTAVHFDSSVLYDQPGSLGLKFLDVSLANQMRFAIGQTPDGVETGVRVIFSDLKPVQTLPDIRSQTTVRNVATPGAPWGAAVADDGTAYVTIPHQVLKISGNNVSVLAGATSSGYLNRAGTAARFQSPAGIAVNPADGALIVADQAGNRIRRVDRNGSASLVAGTGAVGGANGNGSVATFSSPVGVAVDSGGTIYVTDLHRVRRITFNGGNATVPNSYTVSTLAGSDVAGFADASGSTSRFSTPLGITVDEDGNLYVADHGNRRIRMVLPDSRVTTVAGTGVNGRTDGAGNVATFRTPYGIAALPNCGRGVSLVVSDELDRVLRQVSLKDGGDAAPGSAASWIVQTLAGQYGAAGTADGPGNIASFNASRLLGANESGNVYVPDFGSWRLRLVTPNQGFFPIDSTPGGLLMDSVRLSNADGWVPFAGGANRPFITYPAIGRGATSEPQIWSFSVPDTVTAFQFSVLVSAQTEGFAPPEAIDSDISGGKGSVRTNVRTLAGSTAGTDGYIDGMGANSRFSAVIGMGFDAAGTAYVADADNDAIRRVTADGRVSTVAGNTGNAGFLNGRGNIAWLSYPTDVVVVQGEHLTASSDWSAAEGVFLLVTDLDNERVRIVRGPYSGWDAGDSWEPWNPNSYDVYVAAGDGNPGFADGRGNVAQFAAPSSIAMGPGGIFYVLEREGGNRVRTLYWRGGDPTDSVNWQVGLLAGSTTGAAGYTNAKGTSARFDDPRGIAVGPDGTVYVADTYNHCIRKITPDGDVTTLAGTTTPGYVDAVGTNARFNAPWDIAVGPDGYIYVADRYNFRIRRVSPGGTVTTVAGTGSSTRTDATGDASGHHDDLGIAINSSGDLYLAEGECIRVIERIIDVGGPG